MTRDAIPVASPAASSVGRHPAEHDLLCFERVSKWYGPVIGLNQVTWRLKPGITGLVGPNGSGKSTLMKLATGQLRPSLGEVTLRGKSAWRAASKRHLGYCPESDVFYEEMSGRAFVLAMARLFGYSRRDATERTNRVLEQVGMADRAHRSVRGYSKGMRQRIKLAQALVHDPELLILDEPMNGIDPLGRVEMAGLFQRLVDGGKSILISSHQLEELERLTNRIVVMARGRMIAQGTLEDIRNLFEDRPLTIRIDSDRPRELAAALLKLPEVMAVELDGGPTIVTRARQPHLFFPAFAGLVLDEAYDVRHLETLDCSTQAILDYLLQEAR